MQKNALSILSKVICIGCLIMDNIILVSEYNVSPLMCVSICMLAIMWALNGAVWMIDLINSWDKEKRE